MTCAALLTQGVDGVTAEQGGEVVYGLGGTCVGEAVMSAIRDTLERPATGRRRRRGVLREYPAAPETADCCLVGRAEIMRMAGYDPEDQRTGAGWFRAQIERGMFPAHDGQIVDDRPTWRRDTILIHLYLRRHPHSRRRYLIPELWDEAVELLESLGVDDPESAEFNGEDLFGRPRTAEWQ